MFCKHTTVDDVPLIAAAVVGACRGEEWADPIQPRILEALFDRLMGYPCDCTTLTPATIDDVLGASLSQAARAEIVDLMVMVELLCNPIPASMSASVDCWAAGLGVESDELVVARDLARGAKIEAQADFYRNDYIGHADAELPGFDRLFEQYGPAAYVLTMEPDPAEEARHEALQDCAPGSLGRSLWEFYKVRKFAFPGVLGGANLALAQHDWLHVLYGYDTDGIGEVEVAAFRMMSTDFPGAGLGFLGTLLFYQSALLTSLVSGPHVGHELEVSGAPERIADALRRGRACTLDPYDGIDFFDYAVVQVDELRASWSILTPTADSTIDTTTSPA